MSTTATVRAPKYRTLVPVLRVEESFELLLAIAMLEQRRSDERIRGAL